MSGRRASTTPASSPSADVRLLEASCEVGATAAAKRRRFRSLGLSRDRNPRLRGFRSCALAEPDVKSERPRPRSGRASGPLLFRATGIPGYGDSGLAHYPDDAVSSWGEPTGLDSGEPRCR